MINKIKLRRLCFIVIIAFLMSAIGLWLWQFRWPEAIVLLNDEELRVLVAKTPPHLYRGLGERNSLGRYNGMLFLFGQSERHGIVMREMRFPIDIVWFEEGQVVDIVVRAQPEPGVPEGELAGYFPKVPADVVLELPAGWADKHGLNIGDRLRVEDGREGV